MARKINRLAALDVQRPKSAGFYSDGNGLYLQVTVAGTGSWVFRYRHGGRRRDMGLGALKDVSLAEARRKASNARQALVAGIDPIEAKRIQLSAAAVQAAQAISFRECATRYIDAHAPSWRNAKHAAQWSSTLATYAYPQFGSRAVSAIETSDVMSALEPIWTRKPETASRVRGRIESVLDYAKARGWRSSENPARWRGHLQNLLPRRSKIARVQHHPALPWTRMAEFMAALRNQSGIAARALEFTILTAKRTTETIASRWPEFDLDAAAWDIPAERMKADRPHRVPLSPAAVAILREVLPLRAKEHGDWVFPGGKLGKGLSDNAMAAVIDRMNAERKERADQQWIDPKRNGRPVVPHGFRSSFRDWCAEATNHPRELAEAALAHVVKDQTEAAYQRGDLFQKRAQLMSEWADHCNQVAEVVDIAAVRAAA
ncbi:DUF4102 domain-containing protein [Vineibacter terrae]|uniref:DUF4102 domain-containing protein n=1 Tax=Vineibacter terrae TaxID=2586908 RepID=A0A5C8PRR6_9HYPH|nr:site-specific integrase [Vineibacter terrae]TXL78260.1 DUF4102 domain-containing protein [Vineibacter terrae]